MSNRKPHNQDAGYIAEKIYSPSQSHIVIYEAAKQGIDTEGRYAVVCTKHSIIVNANNLPNARLSMKYPDFCGACMAVETKIAGVDFSNSLHAVETLNIRKV